MHTQHGVTEFLIMVEGQIAVGFMITFALYTKTLKLGDVMFFAQGHMILNLDY